MKEFVNYNKRGIQLPKGCKDLADVLGMKQRKEDSAKSGAMGNERCDYCGGPVVCASSIFSGGVLSESFQCEKCCSDLGEFYAKPENTLPEDIDYEDKEVVKKLEEIERRAVEFLRRKVAERKGAP